MREFSSQFLDNQLEIDCTCQLATSSGLKLSDMCFLSFERSKLDGK